MGSSVADFEHGHDRTEVLEGSYGAPPGLGLCRHAVMQGRAGAATAKLRQSMCLKLLRGMSSVQASPDEAAGGSLCHNSAQRRRQLPLAFRQTAPRQPPPLLTQCDGIAIDAHVCLAVAK